MITMKHRRQRSQEGSQEERTAQKKSPAPKPPPQMVVQFAYYIYIMLQVKELKNQIEIYDTQTI